MDYVNECINVIDEVYDSFLASTARIELSSILDNARNAALEEAAHLIECDGDALGGKIGAASAIRGLMAKGGST